MPRAVWKSAEISWYLCGFSCSSRVFHWPQFGIEVQHSKLVRGLRLVNFYNSNFYFIHKKLPSQNSWHYRITSHSQPSIIAKIANRKFFLSHKFFRVRFLFFLCENFPSVFLLYNWENFHKTKFSLDFPPMDYCTLLSHAPELAQKLTPLLSWLRATEGRRKIFSTEMRRSREIPNCFLSVF